MHNPLTLIASLAGGKLCWAATLANASRNTRTVYRRKDWRRCCNRHSRRFVYYSLKCSLVDLAQEGERTGEVFRFHACRFGVACER